MVTLPADRRMFRMICNVAHETIKERGEKRLTGLLISVGDEDEVKSRSGVWLDGHQLKQKIYCKEEDLYLNPETLKRISRLPDLDGLIVATKKLLVIGGTWEFKKSDVDVPHRGRSEIGRRKKTTSAISYVTAADTFMLSEYGGFVRRYQKGYYTQHFDPKDGVIREYQWRDGERKLVKEILFGNYEF